MYVVRRMYRGGGSRREGKCIGGRGGPLGPPLMTLKVDAPRRNFRGIGKARTHHSGPQGAKCEKPVVFGDREIPP